MPSAARMMPNATRLPPSPPIESCAFTPAPARQVTRCVLHSHATTPRNHCSSHALAKPVVGTASVPVARATVIVVGVVRTALRSSVLIIATANLTESVLQVFASAKTIGRERTAPCQSVRKDAVDMASAPARTRSAPASVPFNGEVLLVVNQVVPPQRKNHLVLDTVSAREKVVIFMMSQKNLDADVMLVGMVQTAESRRVRATA